MGWFEGIGDGLVGVEVLVVIVQFGVLNIGKMCVGGFVLDCEFSKKIIIIVSLASVTRVLLCCVGDGITLSVLFRGGALVRVRMCV